MSMWPSASLLTTRAVFLGTATQSPEDLVMGSLATSTTLAPPATEDSTL